MRRAWMREKGRENNRKEDQNNNFNLKRMYGISGTVENNFEEGIEMQDRLKIKRTEKLNIN